MPYYIKNFEWHALMLDEKPAVYLEYGQAEHESIKALEPLFRSRGLKCKFWRRRGLWSLILGRETRSIDSLMTALREEDTVRVGRLLGYPACCAEHMVGRPGAPEDGLRVSNSTVAAEPSIPAGAPRFYTPEMNFLSNYEGRVENEGIFKLPSFSRIFSLLSPFTLTDHLPCSLSCKRSADRGKRVSGAIQKADPDWHSKALLLNGSPVLYLGNFRFYILRGAASSREIKFSEIIFASETASPFFHALKRSDKIRVGAGAASLFAGKKEIFCRETRHSPPAILPFHR